MKYIVLWVYLAHPTISRPYQIKFKYDMSQPKSLLCTQPDSQHAGNESAQTGIMIIKEPKYSRIVRVIDKDRRAERRSSIAMKPGGKT